MMQAILWKLSEWLQSGRDAAGAAVSWAGQNRLLAGGIAAVSVVLIGATIAMAVWLRAPGAPDPETADEKQLVQYMASAEFGNQSDEVQQRYLVRLRSLSEDRRRQRREEARQDPNDAGRREGGRRGLLGSAGEDLTDAQRDQLRQNMRNAFEKQRDDRMKEFVAMDPNERTAYLDSMIDRMQQRQSQRTSRPRPERSESRDGNSPRRSGGRRGFTPERMKNRIENSDPQTRAARQEFIKALRKRMTERGIEFRGRGRGRG